MQAEYVTDSVQSLVDKIAAQDTRDRAAAEALERFAEACSGPRPPASPASCRARARRRRGGARRSARALRV